MGINLIGMTYNFDPDKWYENELFLIQSKFKSGGMAQDEYDRALESLDEKIEQMWKRLDVSYQINAGQ